MNLEPVLAFLALLGPLLVGIVLLFAGLAKALEPQNFVRHLKNLGFLPHSLLLAVAVAFAAFQLGWGAALVLLLWPDWFLPGTIALLLTLAALGYWGTATGRTEDCGCYNDVLSFSPMQSLFWDTTFITLLAFSWWRGVPVEEPRSWRISAALLVLAGGGLLAYAASRYAAKHRKPLIELSPLKAGRRWDPRWLESDADAFPATGEKIVVFLGATCPHCKRWVKLLNMVHLLTDLPEVLGVVSLSPELLPDYVRREGVRFPVLAVKPWVVSRLVRGFTPTAVIIKDGVIQEKWVGIIPKPFVDRVRAGQIRNFGSFSNSAQVVPS